MMKTIGKIFSRSAAVITMLMLVVSVFAPSTVAANAAGPVSDYFNTCKLDTNVWTPWVPTTGGFETPAIQGAYTGESALVIQVPAGQRATVSGNVSNVPRVMQPITNVPFDVVVDWDSALGPTASSGTYRMQGILVSDLSNAANPKHLRIDFNANDTSINFYVGYTVNNTTTHFTGATDPGGVAIISRGQVGVGNMAMRLTYDGSDLWTLRYFVPGAVTWDSYTFRESAPPRGGSIQASFTPTHIGVFAGQTGTQLPGHTSKVDYFRLNTDATVDDAVTLVVNSGANGTVARTCGANPNEVVLTATGNTGYQFAGWQGEGITNLTQNPLTLVMDRSYEVTPTFTQGTEPPPDDDRLKFYLPFVSRP